MDDPLARRISTAELAALLDLSPARVRQLVAADVLPKLGRDEFELGHAVRCYLTFLMARNAGIGLFDRGI
jgi:hypothetical protein